jgi:hypothetical protein
MNTMNFSQRCPLKDAKTPELAYEWSNLPAAPGDQLRNEIELTDMNKASLCKYYRDIGLCAGSTIIETAVSLPEQIENVA